MFCFVFVSIIKKYLKTILGLISNILLLYEIQESATHKYHMRLLHTNTIMCGKFELLYNPSLLWSLR